MRSACRAEPGGATYDDYVRLMSKYSHLGERVVTGIDEHYCTCINGALQCKHLEALLYKYCEFNRIARLNESCTDKKKKWGDGVQGPESILGQSQRLIEETATPMSVVRRA